MGITYCTSQDCPLRKECSRHCDFAPFGRRVSMSEFEWRYEAVDFTLNNGKEVRHALPTCDYYIEPIKVKIKRGKNASCSK
jgi:hypothetical protein